MTVNTTTGNITARKEVLNMLSLSLLESGCSLEGRGERALDEQDKKTSEEIFCALDAVGFYRYKKDDLTARREGGNRKMKFPIMNVYLLSIDKMLEIFDGAITHGFEIIVEDGKFYYVE